MTFYSQLWHQLWCQRQGSDLFTDVNISTIKSSTCNVIFGTHFVFRLSAIQFPEWTFPWRFAGHDSDRRVRWPGSGIASVLRRPPRVRNPSFLRILVRHSPKRPQELVPCPSRRIDPRRFSCHPSTSLIDWLPTVYQMVRYTLNQNCCQNYERWNKVGSSQNNYINSLLPCKYGLMKKKGPVKQHRREKQVTRGHNIVAGRASNP